MLVALNEESGRVVAWEAERGATHWCPACRERVTLKRGQKVISHFAHQPGAKCANAGETRQHLEMKLAFYRAFAAVAPPAEIDLERPLGERRADVWRRLGEGREMAVECQHSALPAEEVRRKLTDYRTMGVDCLYVVHAEAFPGYVRAVGITSLHDRELSVPEWIRDAAVPDPITFRPYAAFSDGPFIPYLRVLVHVWADGGLWALALRAVYRERFWGDRDDGDYLATKREGLLLGRIDDLGGPWTVDDEPGLATHLRLWELARHPDVHPSVADALAAAPVAPAPTPRRKRGEPSCPPPPAPSAPEEPPRAAAPPPPPGGLQLGLSLEDAPRRLRTRRWADYD